MKADNFDIRRDRDVDFGTQKGRRNRHTCEEITMRRILFSIAVIVGLSALVAQSVQSQSEPTKQASSAGASGQDEAKARPRTDRSADEAAIRANIARFVKAYNAGEAKAVAALFTSDGEAWDKEG